MLFDSEQAAQNFIKFNHDEILEENGKAPTRAYYCDMCLGWHVTSMDSFDTTSSYEVLEKRVGLHPYSKMLDADVANLQVLFGEGKYEECFHLAMERLKHYRITKRFKVELFRLDVIRLYIPILSKCLEQLLARSEEALRQKDYHTAREGVKVFNRTANELAVYWQVDPVFLQLQESFFKRSKDLKQEIHSAAAADASLSAAERRRNNPKGNVKRRDAKRLPELLEFSQSLLASLSPYDSLTVAHEMMDLYLTCREKGFLEEDDDIHTKAYSHLIDIIMKFVTLIDKYIDSQAFEQAEYELEEFTSFFTEKFSQFKDDEKMAKIYEQTCALLRQKMDLLSSTTEQP